MWFARNDDFVQRDLPSFDDPRVRAAFELAGIKHQIALMMYARARMLSHPD